MQSREPSTTSPFPARFEIRRANEDDLDDIKTVLCQSMPCDPQWNWRFPFRKKHHEEHEKYILSVAEELLNRPDIRINVVVTIDNKGTKTVISVAVWVLSGFKLEDKGDSKDKQHYETHKFANKDRMDTFTKTLKDQKKTLFDDKYKGEHLHLLILGTLPAYRRIGAGRMNCQWGIKEANKKGGIPITVFASPLGQFLYSSLNFKIVSCFDIRVARDEEEIRIVAMELLNLTEITSDEK